MQRPVKKRRQICIPHAQGAFMMRASWLLVALGAWGAAALPAADQPGLLHLADADHLAKVGPPSRASPLDLCAAFFPPFPFLWVSFVRDRRGQHTKPQGGAHRGVGLTHRLCIAESIRRGVEG